MNNKLLKGRKVWITGASSGIGLEMALCAARGGAHLRLISSRKDALAEAARICAAAGAASVVYDAVDLSNISAASAAVGAALGSGDVPDYLILNAGVSQRSLAAETDPEVTRKIMELNFLGAAAVARTVLPSMIGNGGGRIGVTSSLTGVFGFPMRSSYAASKHALHGYFESVALEYGSAGIRVTMAIPGRIRTQISTKALSGDGTPHAEMDPGLEKGMDAASCAARYWRAVIKGRRDAVIGGSETLMVFLYRYLRPLFRLIAAGVSPV
jgi:short-subunit dehydrogenase